MKFNILVFSKEVLAGEPGFEPRLTESESAVLPLNYSPKAEAGRFARALVLPSDRQSGSYSRIAGECKPLFAGFATLRIPWALQTEIP